MGRPWMLERRSSTAFIVFVISFAVFTDLFLYAIIVPVLPFSLESRANVESRKVGQYITVLLAVYGGAMAIASPIMGWVSDRINSRKTLYLIGLGVMAASTIMLHLGRNISVLIIGRILQGASGAVVWTVGLALLADTVGHDQMGHIVSYAYLGMSLGILLGPLVGGVVYERVGYDAVYAIVYACIGADVVLRFLMVEKKTASQWLDEGVAAERPLPESQTLQAVELGEAGSSHQVQTAGSQDAKEQKKTPSLIYLLKSTSFVACLWGVIVLAIIQTTMDTVLPLFVKETFHWNSLGAGVLFLAIVIPSFLGPLVGRLTDKYGGKWFAVAGLLASVPIMILLRVVDHNSFNQKATLVALLALLGLCCTLIITPLTTELTLVASKIQSSGKLGTQGVYAQAFGLFNFAFSCGMLIGPFWSGPIFENSGWATMNWTIGLLCGVSAIPTAIWCGKPLPFLRKSD